MSKTAKADRRQFMQSVARFALGGGMLGGLGFLAGRPGGRTPAPGTCPLGSNCSHCGQASICSILPAIAGRMQRSIRADRQPDSSTVPGREAS